MPSPIFHRHSMAGAVESARASQAQAAAMQGHDQGKKDGGEDYSFWDLLDVVNPLQHIPVVGQIYRAVSGDTIRPEIKVAGSVALFGPIGLATAGADALLKVVTGRDTGEHVMAMFRDDAPVDPHGQAPIQVAGTGAPVPSAAVSAQAPSPEPVAVAQKAASVEAIANDTAQPNNIEDLRREQLRRMAETPGGSAAAMAVAGVPLAGPATLPAPGMGGSSAVMAAMMDEQRSGAKTAPAAPMQKASAPAEGGGKRLADYWSTAVPAGVVPTKTMLPPKVNQMADLQRASATRAALLHAQEQTGTAPQAAPAVVAQAAPTVAQAAPSPLPLQAPTQKAAAQPEAKADTTVAAAGGPPQLPAALIADLMAANIAKYENLKKGQGSAGN